MRLKIDSRMFKSELILTLTFLVFSLFGQQPAKGFTLSVSSCSTLMCRPGRECRQHPGSSPHCACVLRCPEHWKPVCGSDGESYDNHCLLHRAACLSGAPVSPLHPGFCRKERKSSGLKEWRQHQTTSTPPPSTPSACLQRNRDDLRDFIQRWFLTTSNVSEPIWQGVFPSLDSNDDGFLDSEEFLSEMSSNKMFSDSEEFLSKMSSNKILTEMSSNKMFSKTQLPKSNPRMFHMVEEKRQLCVDALVEEGDVNSDWRLDIKEFSRLFDSSYLPSDKSCNLNGFDYQDGRTTSLECNSCICACGKWICTSEKCPQHPEIGPHHLSLSKNADPAQGLEDLDDENSDEDEDYSEDDDELPEDDPDVQHIRWF